MDWNRIFYNCAETRNLFSGLNVTQMKATTDAIEITLASGQVLHRVYNAPQLGQHCESAPVQQWLQHCGVCELDMAVYGVVFAPSQFLFVADIVDADIVNADDIVVIQ